MDHFSSFDPWARTQLAALGRALGELVNGPSTPADNAPPAITPNPLGAAVPRPGEPTPRRKAS